MYRIDATAALALVTEVLLSHHAIGQDRCINGHHVRLSIATVLPRVAIAPVHRLLFRHGVDLFESSQGFCRLIHLASRQHDTF